MMRKYEFNFKWQDAIVGGGEGNTDVNTKKRRKRPHSHWLVFDMVVWSSLPREVRASFWDCLCSSKSLFQVRNGLNTGFVILVRKWGPHYKGKMVLQPLPPAASISGCSPGAPNKSWHKIELPRLTTWRERLISSGPSRAKHAASLQWVSSWIISRLVATKSTRKSIC